MDKNHQDYNCMRDQYLELLWAAQKVADRRLTELILQRLKDTAYEMTVMPTPACEIIPFPSIIVPPMSSSVETDPVHPWPRQPLRHLLSFVLGYFVIIVFFGVFGISS